MSRALLLLTTLLASLWLSATERTSRALRSPVSRARRDGGDGGDVPGWVMVTIMSAALAVVLITVAGPKLSQLFTSSVDKVSNTPGK